MHVDADGYTSGSAYDGSGNLDAVNTAGGELDFVLDAVRVQLDEGFAIGPQSPLAGEPTASSV